MAGDDVFVYSLAEDSGDDRILDFQGGAGNDALRLTDVFEYAGSGVPVTALDLDGGDALGDGWSVSDVAGVVTVTLGDNDGDGVNGGNLGTIEITGISTGSIDSFFDLAAVIDLEINP